MTQAKARKAAITLRLTEARIRDLLPPVEGRDVYHDDSSPLQLRVSPSGGRVFLVQRRVNGKPTRTKLGQWPELSVDIARKRAHAAVASMLDGVDPGEERRRRRAEAQAEGYTVANAIDDYLDDAAKGIGRKRALKASTLTDYQKRRPLLADLLDKKADDLKALDIDRLKRSLKGSQASHAIKLLRAAINHASARGVIDHNVFIGRRGDAVAPPPRKNHVAPKDIGRLLASLEALQDDDVPDGERIAADALLLMTVYGLRRTESLMLPVADVDFEAEELLIRETKNHDPLRLPITTFTYPILYRRVELAMELASPFVFPTLGNRPAEAGWLKEPRPAIRRVTAATGLDFTCHDLRRTFATFASRRLPHAQLKAILNHRAERKGDITLDYLQIGVDQLREPLQALHEEMGELQDEAGSEKRAV
ncbi:MAG: integrase family protein [Planctomycetota bacterium]